MITPRAFTASLIFERVAQANIDVREFHVRCSAEALAGYRRRQTVAFTGQYDPRSFDRPEEALRHAAQPQNGCSIYTGYCAWLIDTSPRSCHSPGRVNPPRPWKSDRHDK